MKKIIVFITILSIMLSVFATSVFASSYDDMSASAKSRFGSNHYAIFYNPESSYTNSDYFCFVDKSGGNITVSSDGNYMYGNMNGFGSLQVLYYYTWYDGKWCDQGYYVPENTQYGNYKDTILKNYGSAQHIISTNRDILYQNGSSVFFSLPIALPATVLPKMVANQAEVIVIIGLLVLSILLLVVLLVRWGRRYLPH